MLNQRQRGHTNRTRNKNKIIVKCSAAPRISGGEEHAEEGGDRGPEAKTQSTADGIWDTSTSTLFTVAFTSILRRSEKALILPGGEYTEAENTENTYFYYTMI